MIRKKRLFSVGSKIAFIGGGRMAEAVICGLLKSKKISPEKIIVSDIKKDRLDYLKREYGINFVRNNQEALKCSKIVVLAVKPQNFPDAIVNLDFSEVDIVISIAAGITIDYLKRFVGVKSVIRAMPNNPALIQEGITAISPSCDSREKDIKLAEFVFSTVGRVVQIKESLMDAVTALSGSGPGFVYFFIEAMIEAGESLGFVKSVSEELAVQTFFGSIQTLLKTKKSARELREMVTSPGGTTRAGLDVLESGKFKEVFLEAVKAAAERSKSLSQKS